MGDEQPTFRKYLLPTVEESLLDTAMRIPTTGTCSTVRDSKSALEGQCGWLLLRYSVGRMARLQVTGHHPPLI